MRLLSSGCLSKNVSHVIPCDICHGVRDNFVCRVECPRGYHDNYHMLAVSESRDLSHLTFLGVVQELVM